MVKNTSIKKSASKTSKGKSSIEKGKNFEDTVADIFRLLGAEVIQNIEICQKKVDILATFRLPGSPTSHRVIVECKDEKKAVDQNTRVMYFKGLLDLARESGEADSAEIITRVSWSDPAKGFAHRSGIALLTYTEKIAQLIDFKSYLKETVKKFENGDPSRQDEPPLGAYYIDLSAERITIKGTEQIPIIDDYIHQWMKRSNTQHLAILGEYGTGKSSYCQKLTHDLAASYLQTPGSFRIPILFNLREFTKNIKIEYFVTSFLDGECGVSNPRFKLFQAMNDAGIFLLIFDGFDEMAVKVNIDTLEINLNEIEKLAASPNSKVIITSRLEYFISCAEEKKILCPKGELLASRQTDYESLKIIPWDDEKISSFLKKRVPLIKDIKHPWTYYRDRIERIEGLSDLSRRPVLLDMIVKTLPQMIESGTPINRPNLYETYLLGEIRRQKILKQRTLLLSDVSRFSLLKHLSLDLFLGEIPAITFADALKHVEEFVIPPKIELEAYTRDFLTSSFLIRKGDEYQFSHRSIMEYLIARGLVEDIEKNDPNAFARKPLGQVVIGFLTELKPNTDILWDWIESTKSGKEEVIKFIGGNAVTLICELDKSALIGKDLSRAILTEADLFSTDLRNINLSGTVLKNVSLINAQFFRKDLESASVSNLEISICYLFNLKSKKKNRVFDECLKLSNESKFNIIRGITMELNKHFLFGALIVQVPDIKSLEILKSRVAAQPGINEASIYYDEYEKLFAKFPECITLLSNRSIFF